jgi:hypothetical protein
MDAAGECLSPAPDEIAGRGSQHQEPTGTPFLVHERPKDGKEVRSGLDFVDADQLIDVFPEKKLGIGELAEIGRKFEVQENDIGLACQNMPDERGFAALAGSEKGRDGVFPQGVDEVLLESPPDVSLHIVTPTYNLHISY